MTNCQLEKCFHMVNMDNLSYREMWRQIRHVEKFLHKRNVETNLVRPNSCCLVAKSVLLPFMLFRPKIYFVAIHVLMHAEKFQPKLCLWRKKDKYQTWGRRRREKMFIISLLIWCFSFVSLCIGVLLTTVTNDKYYLFNK